MTSKTIKKNSDLSRKQATILGIKVDSTTEEQVLDVIGQKVAKRERIYVVTPNPEIILQAQKDKSLAEIINKADISVPDGTGLRFAIPDLTIIHGRKLMIKLFEMANRKEYRVFFITSNLLNTKDKLMARLASDYPRIKSISMVGPSINSNGQPVTEVDSKVNKDIVKRINGFKPEFLFVCFGQGKQEKWISNNLGNLKVNMAIGIGGALDYYAGTKSLPPKWMEYLELEWLWRLFSEGNIGRVFNAVVIFPLNLMFKKLKI